MAGRRRVTDGVGQRGADGDDDGARQRPLEQHELEVEAHVDEPEPAAVFVVFEVLVVEVVVCLVRMVIVAVV